MNVTTIFVGILAIASTAWAQDFGGIAPPAGGSKPSILNQVGIDQNLGAVVSGDLQFVDETGRNVQLNEYYGKRPIVLALVYFQCPMLCTMVLNDLSRTMRSMPENLGKDYDVICVSFDPRDTPEIARIKRENYLALYNRPNDSDGWHFLTGREDQIHRLTDTVGFHYQWDQKNQVFAHASGIIVLTPQGKVSRYFYGIDYAPKDLRLALDEASGGHVGGLADAILLYCFHYDPATGKYGLVVNRSLKIGGATTCLLLGGLIFFLIRSDKSRLSKRNNGSSPT